MTKDCLVQDVILPNREPLGLGNVWMGRKEGTLPPTDTEAWERSWARVFGGTKSRCLQIQG